MGVLSAIIVILLTLFCMPQTDQTRHPSSLRIATNNLS